MVKRSCLGAGPSLFQCLPEGLDDPLKLRCDASLGGFDPRRDRIIGQELAPVNAEKATGDKRTIARYLKIFGNEDRRAQEVVV